MLLFIVLDVLGTNAAVWPKDLPRPVRRPLRVTVAQLLLHEAPRIYRRAITAQPDLSVDIGRRGHHGVADFRRAGARPWPRAIGAGSLRPKPASVDAANNETALIATHSYETQRNTLFHHRAAGLSPVRRTVHLELMSLCVFWDTEQPCRITITQRYRQCTAATVLQILHRGRPAVLFPQPSRSPHTESGYRLYRYPVMYTPCTCSAGCCC